MSKALRFLTLVLIGVNIVTLTKITHSSEVPSNRLFVNQHTPNVVRLYLETGGRCSGFIVAPGLIASAAHCFFMLDENVLVEYDDGVQKMFKVVEIGTQLSGRDFSLITGDTRGIKPFELSTELPSEGMCIHVGYGGPEDHEPQASVPCFITGILKDDDYPVIQVVGQIIPGDSGGVLIGPDNKAIGVVFAHSTLDTRIGYVAPLVNFKKEIDAHVESLRNAH